MTAQKSTQAVLGATASDRGGCKDENVNVSLLSTQDDPTVMSLAGGLPAPEPPKDYANQSDDCLRTDAHVPETLLSEATLSVTRPQNQRPNSLPEQPDKSHSLRSDEFNVSLRPLTDERLAQRISTLIGRHTEVLAGRVNARESRTKLKNKKRVLDGLDAQYMEKLEAVFEKDSMGQLAILKQGLQQLKLARAEIVDLEAEYEEKANLLVQSEAGLKNLESKIYKSLVKSPSNSLRPSIEGISERRRSQQELSESDVDEWEVKVEHPPEVQAYLSQRGDVNLLRERLMDKDLQFVQLTEEKTLRGENGLDPELDTEEFLATFEVEREVLATQLEEAETVLFNLAANLPEETRLPTRGRLFADFTEQAEGPSREHSLFGRDDYYDEEAVADEQVMAAAAALLPSTEPFSLTYTDLTTDATSTSIDKASYINSWQLHRLLQSTREIARLLQVQEAEGLNFSPEDLRARVLETWMHDGTMQCDEFPHIEDHARGFSMAARSGASCHSRPKSDPQVQAWQAIEFLMQKGQSISHAETT